MEENKKTVETESEGETFQEAWTEAGTKLMGVCKNVQFALKKEAQANKKDSEETDKELSEKLKKIL